MAKTNAARELLAIINKWTGVHTMSSERTWPDVNRAVQLLDDVTKTLVSLEAHEDYSELLASLRGFIYAPSHNWSTTKLSFDSRDKATLRAVGHWLDSIPTAVISLTPEQIDALRSALQECLNIINAEHPEGEELFNYLRYVLSRCLELLEGESVDLFGLRSLSYEATALCIQATPRISDVRRKAWLNEAGKISLAFGRQVAAGATANVLGAGIVGLLGS